MHYMSVGVCVPSGYILLQYPFMCVLNSHRILYGQLDSNNKDFGAEKNWVLDEFSDRKPGAVLCLV